jgi:hypothetical protein
MRLIFAESILQFCNRWRETLFPVLLLFAVWLSGCGDTCFAFISNPSSGSLKIGVGGCKLTPASATVRLMVQGVQRCTSCPASSRIRHIFVSIRGIDVHEGLTPDAGSPDWQELAPHLAKQPLQIDLLSASGDQVTKEPLEEIVTVPAGVYRQLRVRFADDAVGRIPLYRESPCGGASANCVVMDDDTVRPLLFDTASPELRITPERIANGSLLILPDIDTDLIIELKPVWTFSNRRDVRLLPILIGSAKMDRVEDKGAGRLGN